MCFCILPSTAWPWSRSGTPSAIPGREQQLPGGCSTRENLAPSHSAPEVLPEGFFPPLGAHQTAQHEKFCCTSAEDCFSENLWRILGGCFFVYLFGVLFGCRGFCVFVVWRIFCRGYFGGGGILGGGINFHNDFFKIVRLQNLFWALEKD